MDKMNTGTVVSFTDSSGSVLYREPYTPPVPDALAEAVVPPGCNIVAWAWSEYGDKEDWVEIMASNPSYLYPIDLERAAGERVKVGSNGLR